MFSFTVLLASYAILSNSAFATLNHPQNLSCSGVVQKPEQATRGEADTGHHSNNTHHQNESVQIGHEPADLDEATEQDDAEEDDSSDDSDEEDDSSQQEATEEDDSSDDDDDSDEEDESVKLGTLGFSIGLHRATDNSCKDTDDFIADLNVMEAETDAKLVRTYTTVDCQALDQLLPALKQFNMSLILGMFPNNNSATPIQEELAGLRHALVTHGADQIYAISVASEALYRGDYGPNGADTIVGFIKQTKDLLKELNVNKPVGYHDTWNFINREASDPATAASDIIFANGFPFWQGQHISNNTATLIYDIIEAEKHIQAVKGDTGYEFAIGETGFPTGGKPFGAAVPSNESAALFFQEAVCGVMKQGYNITVFELLDEPQKPLEHDNDVERNWGAFFANGQKKYEVRCKKDE